MTPKQADPQRFNIMIVGQQGRLQYEAVLFAASLRAMSPEFAGQLIVASSVRLAAVKKSSGS